MGAAADAPAPPARGLLHAARVRALVAARHQPRRLALALAVPALAVVFLIARWATSAEVAQHASFRASARRWLSPGASAFAQMRGQGELAEGADAEEPPVGRSAQGPGWHGTAVDAGALMAGTVPPTSPPDAAAVAVATAEPSACPVCAAASPAAASCASQSQQQPSPPLEPPVLRAGVVAPSPPHWPWVHAPAADEGESHEAAPATSTTAEDPPGLPPAHGGHAQPLELLVSTLERARELAARVSSGAGLAATWTLTPRQSCDVELLLSGGFTPLVGFMDQPTYASVLQSMRLPAGYPRHAANATPGDGDGGGGGVLWPMPITLDLPGELAQALVPGDAIGLRDAYFHPVAVLTVSGVWRPDKAAEARAVLGTADASHPGVDHLLHGAHGWYVGGALEGIALPAHLDFGDLRRTPRQLRAAIAARGWPRAVAFQTRNPMHRAHIVLTRLAAADARAGLLLHPVVGVTKPGDVEGATRVRCYQALLDARRYYDPAGVLLSLLPLAMRMAGPREALWHAIIRLNHGARHFIVGRDHAGCKSASGRDFYGLYDAQALVQRHAAELGVVVHVYAEVVFVPSTRAFLPVDRVPAGTPTRDISGTRFRAMMAAGARIPRWYSDPGVIALLRALLPPAHARGLVLLLSGLSGGGKSTLAGALAERFASLLPGRRVVPLDGDVARTHLTKGLGFTVGGRNANVARLGWVAAQVASSGGLVLVSAIAPFEAGRAVARAHALAAGANVLTVHVATPLLDCAARDVKGLYAAAIAGGGGGGGGLDLTGVLHPYEAPHAPDVVVDGDLPAAPTSADDARDPADGGVDVKCSVADGVAAVVAQLVHAGYVQAVGEEGEGDAGGAGGEASDDDATTELEGGAADPPQAAPLPLLSPAESALLRALRGGRAQSSGSSTRSDRLVAGAGVPGDTALSPWVRALLSGDECLARVFPRHPRAPSSSGGGSAVARAIAQAARVGSERPPPPSACHRAGVCPPTWDVLAPASADGRQPAVFAGRAYRGSLTQALLQPPPPAAGVTAGNGAAAASVTATAPYPSLASPRSIGRGSPLILVAGAGALYPALARVAPQLAYLDGAYTANLTRAAQAALLAGGRPRAPDADDSAPATQPAPQLGSGGAWTVDTAVLAAALRAARAAEGEAGGGSHGVWDAARPLGNASVDSGAAPLPLMSDTVEAAEGAVLHAPPSGSTGGGGGSGSGDSGSGDSDAVATLAAYDVWTLLRWIDVARGSQSVAFGSPHWLPLLGHVLAMDPCAFALVAVRMGDGDGGSGEAAGHEEAADGVPAEAAVQGASSSGASEEARLREWHAAALALQRRYPERVRLVAVEV